MSKFIRRPQEAITLYATPCAIKAEDGGQERLTRTNMGFLDDSAGKMRFSGIFRPRGGLCGD